MCGERGDTKGQAHKDAQASGELVDTASGMCVRGGGLLGVHGNFYKRTRPTQSRKRGSGDQVWLIRFLQVGAAMFSKQTAVVQNRRRGTNALHSDAFVDDLDEPHGEANDAVACLGCLGHKCITPNELADFAVEK